MLYMLNIDECSEAHSIKLYNCHPNASRAHTTVLAILHMSVMVLIVKVSFVFFEAMKFIFCSSG